MPQRLWTISFAPAGEGTYNVTLRRTGSVHRFETKLPPDITDLWSDPLGAARTERSFRGEVAKMSPQELFYSSGDLPTLKDIGERVLNAMFNAANAEEGVKIIGALEDRISDNEGLEIQVDLSQAAELSAFPWESLYLRSKDRFLAIGTTSNIVRRLDAQSEVPEPVKRPIRVLVVTADARDELGTDVELGNIEKRIEGLVGDPADGFTVEALPHATREAFRRKLHEFKPHIIHYIGHSAFKDGEGRIYLESGEKGVSDPVSAEILRNMLLNDRPWLVVLNSCQSGITASDHPMAGVAQNLLGRLNIPFVVAMQRPVSDDAAIAFSQDFYAALTSGESIASAVSIGRNAIASNADVRTQVELITPALYTSGDTDRIAFAESEKPAASPAPPAPDPQSATPARPGFLDRINTTAGKLATLVGFLTTIVAGITGTIVWFATHGAGGAAGPREQVTNVSATTATPMQTSPPREMSAAPVRRPASVSTVVVSQKPVPVRVRSTQAMAAPTPPVFQADTQEQAPDLTGSPDEEVAEGPAVADRSAPQLGSSPPSDKLSGQFPIIFSEQYASSARPPSASSQALALPWARVSGFVSPALGAVPAAATLTWPAGLQDIAVCDGTVATVTFPLGRAAIPAPERETVTHLSKDVFCPRSRMVVSGFTDSSGPPAVNGPLSLARATALAELWQGAAVAPAPTVLDAWGETRQAIPTPDGVANAVNRRAEVRLRLDCPAAESVLASLAPSQSADALPADSAALQSLAAGGGTLDAYGFFADPQVLSGEQSSARLQLVKQQLSQRYGIDEARIIPMKAGASCLKPGETERIDLVAAPVPGGG